MNKQFSQISFFNAIANGIGQIMLQENKWTGLFFIAGLFIGNWQYAVAAIVAAAVGTMLAIVLAFNNDNINAGLYGFSPALVGIALIFLFANTLFVWILIIAGAIAAALLQHLFITKKIPGYTFPFIVITWLLIFFIRNYTTIPPSNFMQTKFMQTQFDNFFSLTNGFGEVMFQSNKLSGILFFIGVLISKPITALYALTASLIGILFALLNGQMIEQIQIGLFGFNTLLTAIVFSASKKLTALWVVIGSVITIAIHILLVNYAVLNIVGGVFTFPFVAGSWITLFIQKNVAK